MGFAELKVRAESGKANNPWTRGCTGAAFRPKIEQDLGLKVMLQDRELQTCTANWRGGRVVPDFTSGFIPFSVSQNEIFVFMYSILFPS